MATQKLKNNNASLLLDTGVGYQYNISSSLSFSGKRSETGESTKQQCRMDSRFRGNDRGEYGRFPLSVSLGRSETKTRGAIIAESGRSMVEMVGTLAIIGILSVGGVMGYKYGMDKYHANEVINDVNMRMIDIAGQVFRNQSEIAIPEDWDIKGRSGYVIDLFQNTDSEPSIMVEKVPTSVCKEVLKSTPDTQDIYVGVLNGEQVDGNWYLGDNEDICEGSDKEMLFAMSPEILAGFNPDSEEYVEPEGTETVSVPVVTKLECYSNADCRPKKPYCDNGTCVECTQDSQCKADLPYCDTTNGVCHECESNADCDAGQFCADTNESKSSANPYTCKTLSFSTIELTNEEGVTETWHYSNDPMTWWDTNMACEAMNLRMPKFLELSTGENQPGWSQYFYIREHVKTLYNLLTKSSAMTDRPYILISDKTLALLSDGYIPNWGSLPKNKNDGTMHIMYGVCKE